jgi:hypothetical protein
MESIFKNKHLQIAAIVAYFTTMCFIAMEVVR